MLCCKLSFLCCHWEFVCCQLICSYSTINDSAVRRGTFYSNQITTFLNTIRATNLNYFFHLLCNILLYYKFSRWAHYGVCFDSCCQSKTCAEVGIFVLPSVEVVFWCCLEIKYWAGFFSLTLILGLSIKTYIPVVWALEQFWDLVKYFLSKANPFRNINRAIIRRVFRIGGTSQSVSKASKGHKKPLNTWRCLRNVSSFSTLQEF